jgi:Na+/melibiose symporter-like transporter
VTGRAALSRRVLLCYAGVTIPMAAMGMPISIYLPQFYSAELGLSLVIVGSVFTLARVWDLVTDPLMGWIIDRFDTRWGRRKHWIVLSLPILIVSVWAVFMPNPDHVSGGYLLFWLLTLYVGYTMLAIAHQSWGAELAQSYDDRSRLFGWREGFVIAGMTAVLAIPALLELTGHGDNRTKVASMGWFCLILFPILAFPTLRYVPDTHTAPGTSVPWREALRALLANRLLWRLIAADLAWGIGSGVGGALYIFIATHAFELPQHASLALLFFFLAGCFGVPVWTRLAMRVGKAPALQIALAYGSLVLLALLFLAEPGKVAVLWGFTILFGLCYGAPPTLLRSLMADLTDLDELQTGQKRSGMFFALLTTSTKLGAALAVGGSFALLELVYGFTPRGANDAAAIDGLVLIYTMGSAGGMMLAFLCIARYGLTRARHAEIRAELDERARQADSLA